MRVTIDRDAEALRIELGTAAEARRVEVADGVAVAYDAADRIVGIEVRGVDPAALHEFSVELAGLADRPAALPESVPASAPASPPPAAVLAPDGRMRAAAAPAPPAPPYFDGPLTWEPEAEAAILRVPFFSRGKARLDAGALARRDGSGRVTVEIVRAVGGR